jgi:hypothetical protein
LGNPPEPPEPNQNISARRLGESYLEIEKPARSLEA